MSSEHYDETILPADSVPLSRLARSSRAAAPAAFGPPMAGPRPNDDETTQVPGFGDIGPTVIPDRDQEPADTIERSVFGTLADGVFAPRSKRALPEPGTRIQRYRLERQIGHGGTSAVFEAHHVHLDYPVALKLLTGGGGLTATRFLREARVLAKLQHHGVVRVIDAGVADEQPFITLEYLPGRTLGQVIDESGPLGTESVLDLLEGLGGVLELQERVGVLHRDIKPRNMIERADGTYCLIDYGVAGWVEAASPSRSADHADVTLTGSVFGTLGYMPPEQAVGESLDSRSDLFALGCTAWHALAGQGPRSGCPLGEALQHAASKPIPPIRTTKPDIAREVESILMRMTAHRPEERYDSASEMLEDIYRLRYEGRAPSRATGGRAFIAMPYHGGFETVRESLEHACEAASLQARRVDRLAYTGDIWIKIVDEIQRARIVVADFTGDQAHSIPNPNVVTEAAYARAVGKPVVLITQDDPATLPFDWHNFPATRYSNTPKGLASLAGKLSSLLRKTIQGAPR